MVNLRAAPDDLIRRAKSAAALQSITLRKWALKATGPKAKK
jgi:hypothetical protein